jgi:hypothetical protein
MSASMRKQLLLVFIVCLVVPVAASADDTPEHPEMWMFDSKPITATTPTKGKDTFKITDRIYARVFYDRPIKDVFALTKEQYGIKVYQKLVSSGSFYDQVDIWIGKNDFENKWLDLEILPDPATAKTKFGEYGRGFHWTWIHDKDGEIKGKQAVYYSMMSGGDKAKDKRSAVITIDFSGMDVDKLKAEAEKVKVAGDKAFSANFGLPKPGNMHSAALAKQAEAMTKKSNRDIKRVKVIFTDDDWELDRNDLTGRILGRVASAAVVLQEKSGPCLLDTGLIRQQYVGGKFRAPGEWANTATTPQEIDCGKAFK